MATQSIVQKKSEDFAVRIIRLCNYLKEEKKEYTISGQIVRSGTSIGANINEALNGASRRDFLAKMYIAFKEARETSFWQRMLRSTGYLNDKEYESIDRDCEELKKILSSITKTTAESVKKIGVRCFCS